MKTYEEMAHNALERIDRYETEQRKRRKTVKRIAVPAVSFCLVAVIGFGAWQAGLFRETPAVSGPEVSGVPIPCPDGTIRLEEVPENMPEHPILRPGDEGYIAPVPTPPAEEPVGSAENEPAVPAAPDVRETPASETDTGDGSGQKGTDSGVTHMWAFFWWNDLSIDGALKNAMENDPDGTFEILATYRPTTGNITDYLYEGKSLSEWAFAAYEEGAAEEARADYKRAYVAYMETVLPAVVRRLTENGIQCTRAPYSMSALTLYVTPEQLKNIPLDDRGSWLFDLAADGLKALPGDAVTPDGEVTFGVYN